MELSTIQSKIYEIRGYRVMLDFDLAEMYGVLTKRLKEQVRRNIERFPNDFMFELTKSEWLQLVANCDQLPENIKHSPVPPFTFTQEGVAMLSGILRSPFAVQINIGIMRAFVAIRNYALQQTSTAKELEEIWKAINDQNEDNQNTFDEIYIALAELASKQKTLPEPKPRNPVGFRMPEEKD